MESDEVKVRPGSPVQQASAVFHWQDESTIAAKEIAERRDGRIHTHWVHLLIKSMSL